MQILLEVYLKRDESPMNNAGNPLNVALDNSTSFKYKASLLGKTAHPDGNDRSLKKYKNSSAFKIFVKFFEVTRNSFN